LEKTKKEGGVVKRLNNRNFGWDLGLGKRGTHNPSKIKSLRGKL